MADVSEGFDFSIVKKAGLTQQDYADLVGISRVAASKHIMGHTGPHKLIEKRVSKILRLLSRAVERGALPITESQMPKGVRREIRLAAIVDALQEQNQ